jgi:hypothetical protein
LRFERDAALIANGPLVLHGPEGSKIALLPQQTYWGGLWVAQAGSEVSSSWRNVEIRGVRGVRVGEDLVPALAGITLYQSPIVLEHCRVLDSYAPVALSVVGASLHATHSEFGAASGDLVRLDAAQGAFARCAFHDALGEAIRGEQGSLEVRELSVQRVQGAALLARGGRAVVRGLRADRVAVGFASAGAEVRVQDAYISRASIAGVLAYEGARLDASAVILAGDSPPILVQEGSEGTLNGAPAVAQALVVDSLRTPKASTPSMTPLGVRFGPSIWLVGYELTTPQLAPGDTIEVLLYWRTFDHLDRQYTIFMHVRDASGETVAGWDMMPRYNTFPTTDWPLVERIDDVHIVPLSKDLPPGEYRIALGLYYWGTGERLPAVTQEGDPIPEAAVVLEEPVTVKEPDPGR